jgi:hypothetical protein
MNEYDSGAPDRSQKRKAVDNSDDKIEPVLKHEERLLQSITNRAPIAKILNEICSALDCQIGNVVSLISLPEDDAEELAAIAMNAALFGLHTFCSEGVITENGDSLGFLEMYSGVPRSPSAGEVQFIERAKCLAAIAIERHNEACRLASCDVPGNRPARGRVLEWPTSMS